MNYFDINVVGQEMSIAKSSRAINIVEGSQKFVKFRFSLDADWENLTVFAQFIQNGQAYNVYLDDNNIVELPPEIVQGKCLVVLYGSGSSVIATTNAIVLTVDEYKLITDGKSIVITKSLYDQMVDYVNNHTTEVETALAEAMEDFSAQMDTLMSMVGTPLKASTASAMTDHNKIYVYVGSESGYTAGNWYYWDGSAWTSGGVYNSTAFQTDKTLAVENMAADGKYTGDAIEDVRSDLSDMEDYAAELDERKAEYNGYYDGMTVGSAEQLISEAFLEDTTPYNFRTAGGHLEIGDRLMDTIVGGSLVVNQLVRNGNFVEDTAWLKATGSPNATVTYANNKVTVIGGSSDSVATIHQGTATGYPLQPVINGHKYMIIATVEVAKGRLCISPTHYSSDGQSVYVYPSDGVKRLVYMYAPTEVNGSFTFNLRGSKTTADGDDVEYSVSNYNCIDLTAMFGSTIADYIYGLEQAEAGKGVAWFKKLFPKSYYPYNVGEIMNVKALAHRMTGFNQWDEEWEIGAINTSTGENASSSTSIRSKNYIPIVDGASYYFACESGGTFGFRFYDANKNFIGTAAKNANQIISGSFPEGTAYIRFTVAGTTYNNDICINLSWDGARDGEYEPYELHSYAMDENLELRGIPKLTEDNELYYDGDIYEADGTVTRKYGVVDLGTLEWAYNSTYSMFTTTDINSTSKKQIANLFPNAISSKYTFNKSINSVSKINGVPDKLAAFMSTSDNFYLFIKDSAYSDAATFKAAMSGVILVYELAEPTTESATLFAQSQVVNNFGTEEYVDDRTVAIPVGHITKYTQDLVAKLEMAPNSPDGDGNYLMRQKDGENKYVPMEGTFDNIVSGSAKQLLSNLKVTDEVPYKFRTSGGSAEIGDREEDTIVGGSLVVNQLVQNGDFAQVASWQRTDSTYTVSNNIATITLTATGGYIYQYLLPQTANSHKYLATCDIKLTTARTNVRLRLNSGFMDKYTKSTTDWQTVCGIYSYSTVGNRIFAIQDTASSDWDAIQVKNCMLIDLTLMFGSTIADYIYSLEQATAGSGVAWFRKYFPNDYYPYNAGEIKSVEGLTSHKMVGFNQWDEEWEVGGYDYTTGEKTSHTDRIRCKNLIPVVPNTTYFVQTSATVQEYKRYCWYDSDRQYISGSSTRATSVIAPDNAYYFSFTMPTEYGTTYNNDVCINLSWDGARDGEYEPYTEHVYPLDDSVVLRGIPKLDANNELYYDGDTYESDGTVTRKYGVVDLGTLNWVYNTSFSTPVFTKEFTAAKTFDSTSKLLCTKYVQTTGSSSSNVDVVALMSDKQIQIKLKSNQIFIADSSYSDVATFKAAMSGVMLVYKLAEPATEEATPFQNPQIVDNWGTEEYVTDSIVPVGHITEYQVNLRDKIEAAADMPDSNGDYILRKSGSDVGYAPLVIPSEIPTLPSADGNYRLVCTVSGGTQTLSWESIS